jgi:hypothetical protein
MTKLIYHDPSVAPGSASAFDRTIMEVVAGQSVLIACPYLNRAILERILERSGKEWRLLTDIEELFRSLTVSGRKQFEAFINDHRSNVRHVSRLHAKVIIAGNNAVVGSANFTRSGMTLRTEMAVVLSSGETVEELRRWFNVLWERSAEVGASELAMLVKTLPADPPHRVETPPLLSSPGVVVETTLVSAMARRSGRWSEAAFFGRVVERWPGLLEAHSTLRDQLKRAGCAVFRGDGPTLATYHIVAPGTDLDVAWVYENGTVYVRWSKLRVFGDDVINAYQSLWGDLIDPTKPDGTDKIDGCNLSAGLNPESIPLIESNLLRLGEMIRGRKRT